MGGMVVVEGEGEGMVGGGGESQTDAFVFFLLVRACFGRLIL